MHPAVADAALHISAVPDDVTADVTTARIPVSLAFLAAPERRNAIVRAPWAFSAASRVPSGSGPVTGDMSVVEAGRGRNGGSQNNWLRFRGLVSKGVASAGRQARGTAAMPKVTPSDKV